MNTPREWEAGFEKQFRVESNMTRSGFAVHADIEVVKRFISTLLDNAREEERERATHEMMMDCINGTYGHCDYCLGRKSDIITALNEKEV